MLKTVLNSLYAALLGTVEPPPVAPGPLTTIPFIEAQLFCVLPLTVTLTYFMLV